MASDDNPFQAALVGHGGIRFRETGGVLAADRMRAPRPCRQYSSRFRRPRSTRDRDLPSPDPRPCPLPSGPTRFLCRACPMPRHRHREDRLQPNAGAILLMAYLDECRVAAIPCGIPVADATHRSQPSVHFLEVDSGQELATPQIASETFNMRGYVVRPAAGRKPGERGEMPE